MSDPLGDRIAATIRAAGPMSVADYMSACLLDPDHGYYTTGDPFGRDGDFTTAPEVSQMFGELVAARLCSAWREQGRPLPASFAEMGPGRGTLMRDMLRTLRQLDPAFAQGADIIMIEASDRLAAQQKKTLSEMKAAVEWKRHLGELPTQPLFLVANELFDALPIRQYVKTPQGWRERVVALDDNGALTFAAGFGRPDETLLPPDAKDAPPGAIVELAPARAALMEEMAWRIARDGGTAILIDYGYATPSCGDTLQAIRRHAYSNVLAEPGKADLTAHVDFAALAAIARRHGLAVELAEQGEFLLRMGLLERAGRLGAGGDDRLRQRLAQDVERLAGPDQMGRLFKVLIVGSPALAGPDTH